MSSRLWLESTNSMSKMCLLDEKNKICVTSSEDSADYNTTTQGRLRPQEELTK